MKKEKKAEKKTERIIIRVTPSQKKSIKKNYTNIGDFVRTDIDARIKKREREKAKKKKARSKKQESK